ncbi:MAG TPA: hypothetical protein VGG44_10300 [Tepidisphaeraceae bacterium]
MSGASSNLGDNQSPAPKSRRILGWLGGIVVAMSVGLCIGFDVHRQFYLRMPGLLNQSLADWDGYIRKETTPGRGVFLKFLNFHDQSRQWSARIYFRAAYLLYPQPVLVTGPSVVVNTAPQLLQDNSYPSDRWLIDRGVGSIVVVDFDPLKNRPFVLAVKWLDE